MSFLESAKKLFGPVGAFFAWLKGVYSELSGHGSSTRFHGGIIVVSGCFIAIYLALKNQNANHLPFVAAFITATYGAIYAGNRYFNNKDLQAKADAADGAK